MPYEIRIPLDRMRTAVLKLANSGNAVDNWQESIIPIEADVTIESNTPQRRTRRR